MEELRKPVLQGVHIDVSFLITRLGLPENFQDVEFLEARFVYKQLPNIMVVYDSSKIIVADNKVSVIIPDTDSNRLIIGDYDLHFFYKKTNVLRPNQYEPYKLVVPAFKLVKTTAELGGVVTTDLEVQSVEIQGEMFIARDGLNGNSAFEIWQAFIGTPESTELDYLAWLRLPVDSAATDFDALTEQFDTFNQAANQAEELRNTKEGQRDTSEGTRLVDEQLRKNAEQARSTAEQARTLAEQTREQAEAERETLFDQSVDESVSATNAANAAANAQNAYNVTVAVPLASGIYYTKTTARAAVPVASRKLGLVNTYALSASAWYTEKFIGTNVSGWTTEANWEQVPDAAKLATLETDLNEKTEVGHVLNSTGERSNQRLTGTAAYVSDADYDIIGFPVTAGDVVRLVGRVDKPLFCIFSEVFAIDSTKYKGTLYQNTVTGTVDVDVRIIVPEGALYAMVSKSKTLDLKLYNNIPVTDVVSEIEENYIINTDVYELLRVYDVLNSSGKRDNQRLNATSGYVSDIEYDIIGFPVVGGGKVRLLGQVDKPLFCIFSEVFAVDSTKYKGTLYQNTVTGLVDVNIVVDVPVGAQFAMVSKSKTLDLTLSNAYDIIPYVEDICNRVELIESIVGEPSTISLDNYVITPNKIYSVCNDNNINRNYSVNIYLSHMLSGALSLFKNKNLWFSNLSRNIFYNSPFTIDPTYNGGVIKSDTQITETIISQSEYINKTITFNHRSVLSSPSKNVLIKHLSIGDSITNQYLANSNKIESWHPNAYWGAVKMLFEMDRIDDGDSLSSYNCIMIGSNRTPNPFNLTYASVNERPLRSFAEAKGGANLQQLRESLWGSPTVNNPFWSGTDFSIATYLTKYRTMDDNGNRLFFDNTGATTGVGGIEGYILSGAEYVLSGVNIGSEVTNTTLFDICTPTSISIQLSQNSTLAMFQTNIAPIIQIIKTELPNVKIVLMVNDAVMTYFPKDYPEYKESDITSTAGVNSHNAQLSIFNYLKTTIEDEANGIYVLANMFCGSDARSLSSIDVENIDGISKNNQVYGLATYAHPNNRAHMAWGYQLYGLLKYINS